MDNNDLRVLHYASKAVIVVVVQSMEHMQPKPWWRRIFSKDRYDRYSFSTEVEKHPDMISIKRLTEQGYLEKAPTQEVCHKGSCSEGHMIEERFKKDSYKITISGKEKLKELVPNFEKDKVVSLDAFKNTNSPF